MIGRNASSSLANSPGATRYNQGKPIPTKPVVKDEAVIPPQDIGVDVDLPHDECPAKMQWGR